MYARNMTMVLTLHDLAHDSHYIFNDQKGQHHTSDEERWSASAS